MWTKVSNSFQQSLGIVLDHNSVKAKNKDCHRLRNSSSVGMLAQQQLNVRLRDDNINNNGGNNTVVKTVKHKSKRCKSHDELHGHKISQSTSQNESTPSRTARLSVAISNAFKRSNSKASTSRINYHEANNNEHFDAILDNTVYGRGMKHSSASTSLSMVLNDKQHERLTRSTTQQDGLYGNYNGHVAAHNGHVANGAMMASWHSDFDTRLMSQSYHAGVAHRQNVQTNSNTNIADEVAVPIRKQSLEVNSNYPTFTLNAIKKRISKRLSRSQTSNLATDVNIVQCEEPSPSQRDVHNANTRTTSEQAIMLPMNCTQSHHQDVPLRQTQRPLAHISQRPRSAQYLNQTRINHALNLPLEYLPRHRQQLYRKVAKLGEGSYATVYKCENVLDGSTVALKEIKLQAEEGLPFTAIREASLLKGLRHANIVLLHDIIHEPNKLIFVFEYMQSDLSKFLELHPHGIHPHNVKIYMFQLLRGLKFCHERKILHRDLKPQNLLINTNGELKLADFGLARAKSVPSRTYSDEVVTLWYRPPDVLLGSRCYSTPLDMWGVGCIFAEMLTGRALFPSSKDVTGQLNMIFSVLGTPDESTWPGVTSLPNFKKGSFPSYFPLTWFDVNPRFCRVRHAESLLSCLVRLNPTERISATQAMHHAYFEDIPRSAHFLPPGVPLFALSDIQMVPEKMHSIVAAYSQLQTQC